MFVGHLGIGLSLKSVEPRINVGVLLFTSLFLDILLGIFVLLGFEQVLVPENYSDIHYLHFSFPYSHSLIAAVFWALIVSVGAYVLLAKELSSKLKVSALLGASVFFHWVCDWVEHAPQLPLFGNGSSLLGLGLWNSLEAALVLEVFLLIMGMALYIRATKNISSKAKLGMVVFMCVLSGVAVVGKMSVTQAPDQLAIGVSMVVQALVVCALAAWIDRPRVKAV
ncbi:hypothetical protein [Solemya elarraichensis gill symbiont]|uniref:Metal-dependent hydrolase n=1 Tax=Solemya elarraichensis gill symbiont TaxID=1918949 RepID=A0A1T2L531_9GAMM|nr:hypothetical protein [Solemya elarraichensis gill symbiont]OOZ40193.1 hypothetical protein BOW52_06225 [Solemya elarraichensis gill symbiont]